jgi:hypothetical protein
LRRQQQTWPPRSRWGPALLVQQQQGAVVLLVVGGQALVV